MSIDVVEYLESVGADLKYSGENVGPNDVAMPCPWCDDPSYHLTVHRTKGHLNCWRCFFDEYRINNKRGWAPSFKALIKEIEECSWGRAKEIWEDIGGDTGGEDFGEKVEERPATCQYPEGCFSFASPGPFAGVRDYAFNYLLRRGFTKYHIEKYQLHFTATGYHQHRIIVPIFQNGVLVNWLGRRFNSAVKSRYLNSRIDNSIVRFAEMVYGAETWQGDVIRIVEGAFDKMRIGSSAVALNRSQFSRKQRNIIMKLGGRDVPISIILDPEAESRAITIGEDLSPFAPRIKVVRLPEGMDPASMEFEQIREAESLTSWYDF